VQNKIIFFIFVIFIFLIGCVQFEVYETFYPNGSSLVLSHIKYDNLVNILDYLNLPTPTNSSWSEFFKISCENLFQSSNFSKSCYLKDNTSLVIQSKRLNSQGFSFNSYKAFPFILYELRIYSVPLPPTESFSHIQKVRIPYNLSFASDKTYINQLRAANIKYIYTISVPGQIIEHNSGVVVANNNLVVDVFSVVDENKPYIYIKSREINFQELIFIAILFILLFLFFDLVILLALKEWARKKQEVYFEFKKIQQENKKEDIYKRES